MQGGIGVIEEGKLKGRKFIIPAEVLVEKGDLGGTTQYARACLKHQKFIPDGGCPECKEEVESKAKAAAEMGL